MGLLSPEWQEGGNAVTVNVLKRDGSGFLEVDGSVTVDGRAGAVHGRGDLHEALLGKR
jgi:hypothetical protein